MYIERFLEKKVNKYLKRKEIIAVIGPRQCGKTTLLKQIYKKLKNALFIDFEDREKLELFEEDIKSFIKLYIDSYDYVFIDEFQYAKEGGKKLKYVFDNSDTKIIISGSSATELSIQSIKYLVGRIFIFNLYPFSFAEYLNYKNPKIYPLHLNKKISKPIINKINELYEEFVIYGGYPRVITSKDKEEKIMVLKNIYNTYFLKEIKEILNLQTDHKLSKLINAFALQIGGVINYNELSTLTGFRYEELQNHINILEKTFICAQSKPYYTNKRTEIIKAPKIFFFDNGFRNIVIKNFQSLEERPDKGSLNENFAATEIIKKGLTLKYWKTKSKAEVDFIIEKNDATMPLEVKSRISSERTTKSFLSFITKYKPEKALIASKDYCSKRRLNNTLIDYTPLFSLSNHL